MMNNTRMGGLAVLMSSLFLLGALPTGSATEKVDAEIDFERVAPILAAEGIEIDTNSQLTQTIVALVESVTKSCTAGRQGSSPITWAHVPIGTYGVYWKGNDLYYSVHYNHYDVWRYNYKVGNTCVAAVELDYAHRHYYEYKLASTIASPDMFELAVN